MNNDFIMKDIGLLLSLMMFIIKRKFSKDIKLLIGNLSRCFSIIVMRNSLELIVKDVLNLKKYYGII